MRSDRSRTRAEERAEEIDISPSKLLADIEALGVERDAAQAQSAEYLLALQRERAEFQNFKRRTAEERDRESGLANDLLLFKVLILADDFDRAIESRPTNPEAASWVEGVEAIDRKLRQLLESEGLRPIEVTPGMAFDPREHEALVNVPGSEFPEGSIVSELQRGYRIRDRILRPARVAIAAGPDPADAADDAPDGSSPRFN
ncbi:MAG TPA: nucleotide exchange factor GrpE [Candidatus Limnocylindrales bacterium]|nr:nucleotide exchange factor GrpE [Candidatus Limnocylindrales bacterium]